MTSITKPLVAMQVAKMHKPGMHLVGGVHGLYLKIGANGARSWVLRVTFRGQRIDRGLGSAAVIGLADARVKAKELSRAFAEGRDPKEQPAPSEAMTFKAAMDATAGLKAAGWKGDKAKERWTSSMERFALPVIGDLHVNEIKQSHLVRVLEPIWISLHPTASTLRARIEMVLDYATAKGHRQGDNPAQFRRLSFLLPNVQRRVVHRVALAWAEIPDLMAELSEWPGAAPLAVRFLILNASRSAEVRGLPRVGEVDEKAALWTIPAERMKAGREHVLPLTDASLEVIRLAREEGPGDFMFNGRLTDRPMHDLTLSAALRRLKIGRETATLHGFRSSFRDWVGDHGHDGDLAEEQLSHLRGSAVERAYSRSKLLARRRALMAAWAAFCTGQEQRQVVKFPKAS